MKNIAIAKITRPRQSDVLYRPRLFRLLDKGRKAPVTWVSAPAGSGKTTLVSSYLDSRKLPSAWYHVDEGDADVATFFYYMGLAAKKAAPKQKKNLPLLSHEYLSSISIFTLKYFEALYARLRPGTVLVFDNCHHVPDDSPFHEMLCKGLSALPENASAILISRAAPPPAYARLQLNGRISVIDWKEIRFTEEESRQVVEQTVGKNVRDDVLKDLYETTQGWAAGLVLMSEKLQHEAIHPEALGNLTQEELFSYFARELFKKTGTEVQKFLLSTAFLPRMSIQMAERFSGMKSAGRILSQLARDHYFTFKHLHPETVYQYHPLFRKFLLSKCRELSGGEDFANLNMRAAELLEHAGQIEDAASIFMETGYVIGLARMIVTTAPQLMKQGRIRTIQRWLGALPPDAVETSPWLLYWSGVCRFPFSYTEGRDYFEKAFHQFDAKGDAVGSVLAWCGIVDTIIYEFGDLNQLEQWITWFSCFIKKQRTYPSLEIEYRAATSMMVALMFGRRCYQDINPWVERSMQLVHKCPDVNTRIQSSVYMALFYAWTGELEKIAAIVRDQRSWGKSAEATPLSLAVVKYSEALYHWIAGIGDCGIRAAAEGLEVSATHGIYMVDHHLIARKLFGAMNIGDLKLSGDFLDRLESVTDGSMQLHMIKYQYHYLPAWHSLLKGDFAKACQQALTSLKVTEEAGGSAFHRAFSNITAAQALLCMRDYAAAKHHVARIRKIARELKSGIIEFNGLLLQAQLQQEGRTNGGEKEAVRTLENALSLGRARGYLNTVVWYGPAVQGLCMIALANGIETDYVRTLIQRRNLIPDEPPLHLEQWPWPVKISTLGGFRLLVDDKPIAFSGKVQKKPLEMLKALIAFGGMDVREEQVIDALWPDAEGDTARISFKTTLHRLRQLLGKDEMIQLQEGRVSLDRRSCWTDVWAFERMLEESPGHPVTPSPSQGSLEKAVSLYNGHFLADDEDKPWTVSLREHLKSKFSNAVAMMGEHTESKKDWKGAIVAYHRGLEVDDLSEEFYRRLMVCYLKLGRRADAIKVYNRCKKVFTANLGVEPSEEMEQLYRNLKGK